MTAALLVAIASLATAVQGQKEALIELPLSGARDVSGEGRAFVETHVEGDTFFVGQPIRVRVQFGVERPFLEKDMVQLFHQVLDVPVQLQAPWLESLPGTRPHASSAVQADRRLSFALDLHVAQAERLENRSEGGHTFTTLEIGTTWLSTQAGDLVIPAPVLRFAWATNFQDDWTGRVPADRREAYVRGPAVTLHVRPLPDEGRPQDFSGAVGQFSMEADVDRREIDVGQSLKLSLRIRGEGNLELFEAPRLEDLAGFHLLGHVDALSDGVRTVTYDLVAKDAQVKTIPPIGLTCFDPRGAGAYTLVETRAIPIDVRAAPHRASSSGAASGLGNMTLWIAGLMLGCLSIVLIWTLRRRPKDTRPARVYDAALRFTRRIEEPEVDLTAAFIEFLAAFLDCTVPAVVGPRLADRLVACGVPSDLATRTAAVLERQLAARQGGRTGFESPASVRAVVDALERAIQPAELASVPQG